jgi:hypothetical protein
MFGVIDEAPFDLPCNDSLAGIAKWKQRRDFKRDGIGNLNASPGYARGRMI